MADDNDKFDAADLLKDLDQVMTEQAQNSRYVARLHDYLERGVKHMPLFRLGITGGFATGKSSVAQMFEDLGCPIVNADTIVHDLLAHDPKVQQDIRYTFGDDVFSGATIERLKLAKRVFNNPQERLALEAILHPKVADVMKQEAERLEHEGHTIACFEIPLLFESGFETWCDSTIVVTCDEPTQIERAMLKFGITSDEAQARIKAQMSLTEKKKRADVIIDNTGPLENLKLEVDAIYNRLQPQS